MSMIETAIFYTALYVMLFASVFWFTVFFTTKSKAKKSFVRPLTLIVPTYNKAGFIRQCIGSLLNQKMANGEYYPLKVMVVDDGSTDNTGQIVKDIKDSRIGYIKKKNGGKASAVNHGLKFVKTEYFGFIDSDTCLSENAIENMMKHFPEADCVTAAIKPLKAYNTIEKLQKIEYVIASFTRKLMANINALYYTPAFALYKTNIIRNLGGFDEKNITEDLEIGLRLQKYGYKISNSIDDFAYTIVPQNFRELFNQRMRWYRGYIHNTCAYKDMFFSRKYSSLGMFVLPLQYILLALTIPLLILAAYDTGLSLFRQVMDVFIVDFDFGYIASTSKVSFITSTTLFWILLLSAFFLMIKFSQQHVHENISKVDYIIYLLVYPFINILLWISAFVLEIVGTERKW
ncbi:MAG: glycosyltransferase family 2 protein [Candidatus Aenigmarchaeota archaeon]|nr:glycosyltransferase family 2 protein [Candidatus Aenigmarchaeota archaeon]